MDGQRWENAPSESLDAANEYARWVAGRYIVTVRGGAGDDRTADVIGRAFLAGAEHQAAKAARRERAVRRRVPRPRNKPFSEDEIRMLRGLDAVDSCGERRIIWNHAFIERAKERLAAGESPTDIFRRAGVGPEVIGHKRIERCVARWRKQIKGKGAGNERA